MRIACMVGALDTERGVSILLNLKNDTECMLDQNGKVFVDGVHVGKIHHAHKMYFMQGGATLVQSFSGTLSPYVVQ